MPPSRTAPMAPRPYGGVVGMLNSGQEVEEPSSGSADVPKSTGPVEIGAGDPAPREPSHAVEIPEASVEQESRIIRPETLTRKYDEAERRIRRQVTQHSERGVRVLPPVNISALEKGGYTVTSGSRVGYDLKRFSGLTPQGTQLGKNTSGNTTSRGGGRAPRLTQAMRMGGPVDPSGRDLLDRYTDVPGTAASGGGVAGRRSSANPRGLLSSAERISRGRAF